jgi:hypothetical protein
MRAEQYSEYVRQLQFEAEGDPKRFRRRAARVARWGNIGAFIVAESWPLLFVVLVITAVWAQNV